MKGLLSGTKLALQALAKNQQIITDNMKKLAEVMETVNARLKELEK